MNSPGNTPVHKASPPDPVIKIQYVYMCMHYKDTSSS